jgi:hypothetical protein
MVAHERVYGLYSFVFRLRERSGREKKGKGCLYVVGKWKAEERLRE